MGTGSSRAGRGTSGVVADDFGRALASLRAVKLRPEVRLEETPAPQRLAPHALALSGDVIVADEELATGRFVLLHDPAGHDAWEGTFRIVTFVRADLEAELAADPLLPGVGWAWLIESLQAHGAGHVAAGGTVTRVSSESFGAMAERAGQAEVEVRASWTPVATDSATAGGLDLGPHLAAWADLLCTAGGLPPLPPGLVTLPRRRG